MVPMDVDCNDTSSEVVSVEIVCMFLYKSSYLKSADSASFLVMYSGSRLLLQENKICR